MIVPGQNRRWPGGVVPFVLDNSLTPAARTAITGAIDHWHLNTRLHLRPRTGADAQWVVLRDSNQCSSWVGRQGSAQDINIAAGCGRGATIHEIGHAVGLWHEQSREDRDKFVSILWQNIQSGQGHNFDQPISDGDDIGEYDFGSIMHYGSTAFGTTDPTTGRTNTTISPNQPLPPGVVMGQRNGLSQSDRGAVAWMYGSIYPSPSNTWLGRFQGQPGTELLHYSPARHHWYLGQTVSGTMDFRDVGDTTGFDDGRPIWTGDFTGDEHTDVLFYYPGDDNWWLGALQNMPGENAQCGPLRSQISSQEAEIRQLQQLKNVLDPRDLGDRQEIRDLNRQITALRQQISQEHQEMAGLQCPAVPNPGGLQLGRARAWSGREPAVLIV